MSERQKDVFPGSHGGTYPDSPAKVPGDRDEAKALPDDIAVNERGGPNADNHYPAAAATVADEEAGARADEAATGRIQPLQPRGGAKPGSGKA